MAGYYLKLSKPFFRAVATSRSILVGSRMCSSGYSAADFEAAKSRLNSLKNEPDNDTKLKLYGLFKQTSVGECNTKKPGALDFVGKAKWSAWSSLGSMAKEEAGKNYIELVNSLVATGGGSAEVSAQPVAASSAYKTLKVTKEGNLMTVVLNRPDKKNAISTEMYEEIINVLTEAKNDASVTVTVFTGAGDYYCSGNDLNNFVAMMNSGLSAAELAELARSNLIRFVQAFIDFPKILIGVINGPATGIAVTLLGLFDTVYAIDKATFHAPFTQLGQGAEGCSSYTFPALMGYAKANEMLMYNEKITATEACQLGLVTKVFPEATFQKEVGEKIKYVKSLPPQALLASKELVKSKLREKLTQVNADECANLKERWQSDECMNAIATFFTRKSKI
ncbi:Enoyl-CoA delta isomerase 2, mitochondrial [Chamberlinius hualienensis]